MPSKDIPIKLKEKVRILEAQQAEVSFNGIKKDDDRCPNLGKTRSDRYQGQSKPGASPLLTKIKLEVDMIIRTKSF